MKTVSLSRYSLGGNTRPRISREARLNTLINWAQHRSLAWTDDETGAALLQPIFYRSWERNYTIGPKKHDALGEKSSAHDDDLFEYSFSGGWIFDVCDLFFTLTTFEFMPDTSLRFYGLKMKRAWVSRRRRSVLHYAWQAINFWSRTFPHQSNFACLVLTFCRANL